MNRKLVKEFIERRKQRLEKIRKEIREKSDQLNKLSKEAGVIIADRVEIKDEKAKELKSSMIELCRQIMKLEDQFREEKRNKDFLLE
jgi:hypothetical protein